MYLLDYSSKTMAYKMTVEKTDIKNNRLKKYTIAYHSMIYYANK